MIKTILQWICAGLIGSSLTFASAAELVIESWRVDDQKIWDQQIIPAFNKHYPDIKVTFKPTAATQYNNELSASLKAGSAGDLITCRPFDASLELFERGYLADLTGFDGMESFPDVAKSAWQTDDGSKSFCLPIASVLHGFFFNKAIFNELGLAVPKDRQSFFAVMDKIATDGRYLPLAMGTKDKWEAATMGFQNIGPNYWKGEEGRVSLLLGDHKLTDQPYVNTLGELARWGAYMGDNFKQRGYSDAIALFAEGKAAVYPAGSWDIATFSGKLDFAAFKPPGEGGECYISDHTDIGIGINANTSNMTAAKTLLSWMATAEFAGLYTNALPGFFSLSDHPVEVSDPVAAEMFGWRGECNSTIRNSYQILSRGEPNLETEIWEVSTGVIEGSMSPSDGAKRLQDGLDSWYLK